MIANENFNIHYLFSDDGHYMDAFIFNKCESQLLGIIQEAKKLVSADIEVSIQPLSEGSLWSRLKFTTKDGKEIKLQWVIALVIGITVSPIITTFDNVVNWAFEYIKDGSYIHNLKKEKERLELEKEVRELRDDSLKHASTDTQNKIKRKVSNFYSEAKKDSRILSLGFCSSVGNPSSPQIVVDRNSFDKFIITDAMEDEETKSNVRIDIIAPVLRKRKIKWQGIYNSLPIAFKLCDTEFKNSVLKGEIDFTGGTYIICDLTVYTSVDKEGETKISGYDVIEVHACGKDDNPPELTTAERKREQKRKLEASMRSLFDFDDETELD